MDIAQRNVRWVFPAVVVCSLLGFAPRPAPAQVVPDKAPPQPVAPGATPQQPAPSAQPGLDQARRIAQAHGVTAWKEHQALQVEMTVTFGGEEKFSGTLLYDYVHDRARIECKDGKLLVWDGSKAYISPSKAPEIAARYHLRTWAWFLAAPFRLEERGVLLGRPEPRPLRTRLCMSTKVAFQPRSRDAADDWYILYADGQSSELLGMAFIVTWGAAPPYSELPAYCVEFSQQLNCDGVKLWGEWKFTEWTSTGGPGHESVGTVRVSNPKFVTPNDEAFREPSDAREDPAP